MRVCVIGTGYVGLVTGACLAYTGHHVICIDNNEEKVALMQSGKSPIFEPGLDEIIQLGMEAGRLEFTTDLAAGVAHGEILFIAVGTPALPTGESDTRYVEAVARGIGSHLNGGYKVIVNKSTVPIGSGDWVRRIVLDGVAERHEKIAGFDIVSNPEFLREVSAVYDTFDLDRIVLGSNSQKALSMMLELYAPIVKREFAENKSLPEIPVLETDLTSAEMIKYAANAVLAAKISFINEGANICDRVGADFEGDHFERGEVRCVCWRAGAQRHGQAGAGQKASQIGGTGEVIGNAAKADCHRQFSLRGTMPCVCADGQPRIERVNL